MTCYVEVPPVTFSAVSSWQAPPRPGVCSAKGGTDGAEPQTSSVLYSQEHNTHDPTFSLPYTPVRFPSDIAKDALLNLLSLPQGDSLHQYDQVCINFVDYLDKCEQKGFMIKGYDVKKGKLINLPMSYNNRWMSERRRGLSHKLDRLNYWFELQQDRPCTMITLTCQPIPGESISSAWTRLNDSRKKLLKLVGKYFGNVDYIWVPEPHKTGYVHYHLVIFADVSNNKKDKRGRGIEDKFRDLWSKKYKTGSHTYGLDFRQKKPTDTALHLKNYLVKYLEKGFLLKSWSIGMLLFNATLWDTGFRMYGASKNIRDIMCIGPKKDDIKTPRPIVWLETRMQTIELTPDNEEVEIDKVIWNRLYIPDWIDSDLWLGEWGEIIKSEPKPLYLYDWGRPVGSNIYVPAIPYDPITARRNRNKDTGW